MSLPNSYLINTGRTEAYFDAIQNAEAPERFSHKFIENLGFTSSNDRLLIGVLKDLGFLDADGVPLERYYQYLDRTQSQKILAEGVKDAYEDLFAVNINADQMDADEVGNKLRTLYSGSKTDLIVGRIAKTFVALCSISDFSKQTGKKKTVKDPEPVRPPASEGPDLSRPVQADPPPPSPPPERVGVKSLQYHINIVLPESRDPSVYDAIFRSLRQHLG